MFDVQIITRQTLLRAIMYLFDIDFLIIVLAGAISAGLFILIAGYIENANMVIVSMCFAGAAAGTLYAGFQVNILDIAPRNASVVMGIANATASTAGFLSPMLVGFITNNKVSFLTDSLVLKKL